MSVIGQSPSFIALDFETSDFKKNSACAIGMVKIKDHAIVETFYSLIRPPSKYIRFTEVHGLTWNMLCDSANFGSAWPQINDFIQGASGFIAHNASFDRGVLYGSCEHYQLNPPPLPFYCTLKASRAHFGLKKNSLSDVCTLLNIPLEHHNALSDATACAKIFLHCQAQEYNLDKFLLGNKK